MTVKPPPKKTPSHRHGKSGMPWPIRAQGRDDTLIFIVTEPSRNRFFSGPLWTFGHVFGLLYFLADAFLGPRSSCFFSSLNNPWPTSKVFTNKFYLSKVSVKLL